ncbi:MAG: phenylalanine--tRNA ligase subunit beta [Ignisphaera sp.]
MPVVKTRLSRLTKLTGISDIEKLREILFNLKCETEVEEDEIAVEVQSDRVDMFSVEGLAYAVKLYVGIEEPKTPSYKLAFKARVEPPSKRPYIAIAAVKNVAIDEEVLSELIEFQERVHTTYGRNRKKIAIGLHDLGKLPKGDITYKEVSIDTAMMVPLFNSRRMSIREVLISTDQGKLYGEISLWGNKHPALLVGEEIIALPPVINSDITRLEPTTRDIFIDVTGTDFNAVMNVLNVIVHALSFYGGEILGAEIHYPDKIVLTPNLETKSVALELEFISKWLGVPKDVLVYEGPKALKRMGYIVDKVDVNSIIVKIPPYRCDILHQVDIVEDIAIGLGYDNLGLEFLSPPNTIKLRRFSDEVVVEEILRDVLIGLGYTEINTLTLVPSEVLNLLSAEPFPIIVNAISKELDAVRNSLIPSILISLRDSQYVALPVKVFEIGEVVEKCINCYNGWRNRVRLGFAIMDSEIKFEEVHADLYVILSELGLEKIIRIEGCKQKAFLDGRCGCIKYDNTLVGVFGEVHPNVLKILKLEYPVAITELYIDARAKIITCRQINI